MKYEFSPLFTGGSGRSGTTIILGMLKNHPQIHSSLPREIKYLTARYGLIDLNFGRPLSLEKNLKEKHKNIKARISNKFGKKKKDLFHICLHSKWWSGIGKKGNLRGLIQGITQEQLNVAIKNFESNFSVDKKGASRAFFYETSAAQIKDKSVKFFAESSPVNMMQANYLYQLFPNAKFINMIRDGRDVAFSVSKESWGPNDPHEGLDWWANRIEKAHKALLKVKPEDQMQMRLEDLIINKRQEEYQRLLSFLKIDDHDQTLEYFETNMLPEKMSQGDWTEHVVDPDLYNREYDKILKGLKSKGIEIAKFY
uniref:sulfotransferase family protein n=1 Tax=Candidatus Planktophila sp. TaxID=2175601 RepID=UPI00404A56AB